MPERAIWPLMYMGHVLNWKPGEYGKGLVHDGAVHTWGVGPNQDGSPTHPEYAEKAFGMNEGQYGNHMMFDTAFGISSDGALNVYDDNGWSSHPENEGKVAAEAMAVDPRLYVPGHDAPASWNFIGGVTKNDEKWQLAREASGSWEPGEWGKGLYYPETGMIQAWSDDRAHMDVWGDDQNYNQPGSAHHFVIRPNGTVHDQGSFDRDFGDAERDVEGLQIALKSIDPRLRLDPPSEWDFGSTEPMEEEPSSVSRGEDGGTVHGVQTGNDYAGGL